MDTGSCVAIWLACIAAFFVLIKLYNYLTMGVYKGKERLDGKTIIVTGANSGSGLETAKDFARRGARVLMVCRDMKKAEAAKLEIIAETKNTNIILKCMDLSSLESIRKCANEIIEEEERIDVLVNNAGAGDKFGTTEDGLEFMMQCNYFGPFLFTNILLGKIKASSPSRIVNVSSSGYMFGKIDLDNLKKTNRTSLILLYSDTKLALNYFTHELGEKIKETGVTVNCLHPGVFASNFLKNQTIWIKMYLQFVRMFFKSCEQGAQTTIYLSVSPDVANITGKYFEDCKRKEMARAIDSELSKKLWDFTEDCVQLKPNEKHYQ